MLRDHWSDFDSTINHTLRHIAQANRNLNTIVDDLNYTEETSKPEPMSTQDEDIRRRADAMAAVLASAYFALKEDPSDGGDAHERSFDNLLQAVLDAHPTKTRADLKDGLDWRN